MALPESNTFTLRTLDGKPHEGPFSSAVVADDGRIVLLRHGGTTGVARDVDDLANRFRVKLGKPLEMHGGQQHPRQSFNPKALAAMQELSDDFYAIAAAEPAEPPKPKAEPKPAPPVETETETEHAGHSHGRSRHR